MRATKLATLEAEIESLSRDLTVETDMRIMYQEQAEESDTEIEKLKRYNRYLVLVAAACLVVALLAVVLL